MSDPTLAAADPTLTKEIRGAIDGVLTTLVATRIVPGWKDGWVYWRSECGKESGRMPRPEWERLAGRA